MIDYTALAKESWSVASVRKKFERILFVFYFHSAGDPLDTVIEECVLWSPGSDLLPQIERDWTAVRDKVRSGRAHEISEGDGQVLGAATKGAGGGKLVSQPSNRRVRAKPRAWALKPALTSWLYANSRGNGRSAESSLFESLGLRQGESFESVVIDRLQQYRSRSLAEVASTLNVSIGRAKSATAVLVRRAIGVLDDGSKIREFEQRGIRIKIVPISQQGRPWEAMSFPKFDHMEVIHEEWEDSDLLAHLTRLLVVPLVREERTTPKEDQVWGNAFFWSPSDADLEGIRREWEDYLQRIAKGEADQLPGYSATEFIHVRPHGRDGSDKEEAPIVGMTRKKSFWLNPGFIARIVLENGGLDGIPTRRGRFERLARQRRQ